MMAVAKNIVVVFRYIMKNSKGQVIENTIEGSPKCYLHGSSGIQPSFQVQFEGLKVGDTKVIYLKKESGVSNDDFTFNIIIDKLRPALEEELMLGYPVMIDKMLCNEDCICYVE
ncbi:MAG: hypothetical protein ABI091_13575 [Ferruginibacter sp.]